MILAHYQRWMGDQREESDLSSNEEENWSGRDTDLSSSSSSSSESELSDSSSTSSSD
jgi:hypothetical protein